MHVGRVFVECGVGVVLLFLNLGVACCHWTYVKEGQL